MCWKMLCDIDKLLSLSFKSCFKSNNQLTCIPVSIITSICETTVGPPRPGGSASKGGRKPGGGAYNTGWLQKALKITQKGSSGILKTNTKFCILFSYLLIPRLSDWMRSANLHTRHLARLRWTDKMIPKELLWATHLQVFRNNHEIKNDPIKIFDLTGAARQPEESDWVVW